MNTYKNRALPMRPNQAKFLTHPHAYVEVWGKLET